MSNRMDTIHVTYCHKVYLKSGRKEKKKKMQLRERGTQVHGKEGAREIPQSQQTLITLYYSTA